jgi:hypothetical protein
MIKNFGSLSHQDILNTPEDVQLISWLVPRTLVKFLLPQETVPLPSFSLGETCILS